MDKHYLLKIDPQEFWDQCVDLFEPSLVQDPDFHQKVRISLTPWCNGHWSLRVHIDQAFRKQYEPIWETLYTRLFEGGNIIRDFEEEEKSLADERKKLGMVGGILIDEVWRTSPSSFSPHLKDYIDEEIRSDSSMNGIGIEPINILGGKQYVIGWGLFSSLGYVRVMPINDIESRVVIFRYKAIIPDKDRIEFYKQGSQFLTNVAKKLALLYTKKSITLPQDDIRVGMDALEDYKNNHPEFWTIIQDHGWDAYALEKYFSGSTCAEIGKEIARDEKTVRNRISKLRGIYGIPLRAK